MLGMCLGNLVFFSTLHLPMVCPDSLCSSDKGKVQQDAVLAAAAGHWCVIPQLLAYYMDSQRETTHTCS